MLVNEVKENNELKNEVKKLSSKLERCYNSKVTFEHILKTQRNFGDKSGLGFKRKMTKGERKRTKKMKKQLQLKLSHSMCYRCHEAGHYAKCCPNIEKLKKPWGQEWPWLQKEHDKGRKKKGKEDEEATTIEVVSLHVLPVP